jgi:hypothetical protein
VLWIRKAQTISPLRVEHLSGKPDGILKNQADRAISTGKLHALLHFHTRPINVVVFHGSDRDY